MSRLSQHVLFYSNYCSHCRQTIDTINKNDLRSKFQLICIDNLKVALPPCVDRVPMIVAPDRTCYADGDLSDFMAQLTDSGSGSEVQAFFGQTTAYSDGFAFISESSTTAAADDSEANDMLPTRYVRFGADDLSIATPSDAQYGTLQSGKASGSRNNELDNLVSRREAELAAILPPQQALR